VVGVAKVQRCLLGEASSARVRRCGGRAMESPRNCSGRSRCVAGNARFIPCVAAMRTSIRPSEQSPRQVVGVRSDEPVIAQLRQVADAEQRSLGGLIRVVVVDWLARRQQHEGAQADGHMAASGTIRRDIGGGGNLLPQLCALGDLFRMMTDSDTHGRMVAELREASSRCVVD
jgi:hypothetical protein